MKPSYEKITLDNIARGAAIELFDIELEQVLENLADPNRDAKAPREIILTVKFTPAEAQGFVAVDVFAKKKMPAISAIRTAITWERDQDTDQIVAREFIKETQGQLFGDTGAPTDKVRPIRPASESE